VVISDTESFRYLTPIQKFKEKQLLKKNNYTKIKKISHSLQKDVQASNQNVKEQ